jgi:hypothetical protein
MTWGFPGVLDRPVAADMDQDGIDDIGLWVPRSDASLPQGVAQWYFLLSNDFTAPGVPAAHVAGSIARINHAFTPVPFGKDIFAEFGDQLTLPIVGNFDPPVAPSSVGASLAGDYDKNGRVDQADMNVWRANYGSTTNMAADGNLDGKIDSADYLVWRKNLGAVAASAGEAAALSVTVSADPPAGWTIGEAAGDEVTAIGFDAPAPRRSTTGVVGIDDFFARLGGLTTDRRTADAPSLGVAVWEADDLLLTTLASSVDADADPADAANLSGNGDAEEELAGELLAELEIGL